MENLFNLWAKRNPSWEKRYEDSIMGAFTDYGKRYSQFIDTRGKIFGPGYEIFIIAFFIGLYSNQTKPLTEDKSKVKTFGHAIMYWGGNEDIKLGRVSYKMLQEYMFAALIARTDIDFIALDKGDISPRTVVDKLVEKWRNMQTSVLTISNNTWRNNLIASSRMELLCNYSSNS